VKIKVELKILRIGKNDVYKEISEKKCQPYGKRHGEAPRKSTEKFEITPSTWTRWDTAGMTKAKTSTVKSIRSHVNPLPHMEA